MTYKYISIYILCLLTGCVCTTNNKRLKSVIKLDIEHVEISIDDDSIVHCIREYPSPISGDDIIKRTYQTKAINGRYFYTYNIIGSIVNLHKGISGNDFSIMIGCGSKLDTISYNHHENRLYPILGSAKEEIFFLSNYELVNALFLQEVAEIYAVNKKWELAASIYVQAVASFLKWTRNRIVFKQEYLMFDDTEIMFNEAYVFYNQRNYRQSVSSFRENWSLVTDIIEIENKKDVIIININSLVSQCLISNSL